MKTEKLKLPNEGTSIYVPLTPNDFGARSVKITNWKDARYYFAYKYKTQYNQKEKNAGWIATDGSDWEDLYLGDDEIAAVIHSLYPLIGGAIAD